VRLHEKLKWFQE